MNYLFLHIDTLLNGSYQKYLLYPFILTDKSSTPAQQHQLEKKSFLQKRSKSSKNQNVEHHVKGILNSLVLKSQQKDKQQVRKITIILHKNESIN